MTEGNKTPDFNLPSKEELEKAGKALEEEMEKLKKIDEIYSGTVKERLEKLRGERFTGTSDKEDEEGGDAACTVTMTSQYQAEEVNINPNLLLKILGEAQIDIQNIEIDQLVHICVTLGESARLAFNNAREKTHKGSEEVFNHLMEEMQTGLFGKKDSEI